MQPDKFKQGKIRIAIGGLGAVGGFYAAMLSHYYNHHAQIEIMGIVKRKYEDVLKQNGLRLEFKGTPIITNPHIITADPSPMGIFDVILLCCKTYDLEEMAKLFQHNVSESTVIIPLQNGIGSDEVVKKMFPTATVLKASVYIVSLVKDAGNIQVKGLVNRLLMGHPQIPTEELEWIRDLFMQAGCSVELYRDMDCKQWQKFAFIAPIASLTSAYQVNVGQILKDESLFLLLKSLMKEIVLLANSLGISLPETIIEQHIDFMKKLDPDTYSSMYWDFKNNSRTEIKSLTHFPILKGKEMELRLESFEKVYTELQGRI